MSRCLFHHPVTSINVDFNSQADTVTLSQSPTPLATGGSYGLSQPEGCMEVCMSEVNMQKPYCRGLLQLPVSMLAGLAQHKYSSATARLASYSDSNWCLTFLYLHTCVVKSFHRDQKPYCEVVCRMRLDQLHTSTSSYMIGHSVLRKSIKSVAASSNNCCLKLVPSA